MTKTSPAAQGTVARLPHRCPCCGTSWKFNRPAEVSGSAGAYRCIECKYVYYSPSPEALPASGVEAVDAQTAFEARHRGLNLDRMEGHFTGYRDPHTDARWLGWKACWARVEALTHALDQMRGPLSTAALVARAEKAEAALSSAPAPEDR